MYSKESVNSWRKKKVRYNNHSFQLAIATFYLEKIAAILQ